MLRKVALVLLLLAGLALLGGCLGQAREPTVPSISMGRPTFTPTAIGILASTSTPCDDCPSKGQSTPPPTATDTSTPRPTATDTSTPRPTATDTPTPRPTATDTPTPALPPAPLPGHPAPDFTLPDLEGNELSLSDFEGQAVLVNFWTTW